MKMCSISVAVNMGGLNYKDLNVFVRLMLYGQTHGRDAWGVGRQDMQVLKQPDAFDELMVKPSLYSAYRAFLRKAIGQKWIVGHNRQATRGSPKQNKNNHPLPIIINHKLVAWIIHNGVVEATKPKYDVPESMTDSYIIANSIARHYKGNLYRAVVDSLESGEYTGTAKIVVWNNKSLTVANTYPIRGYHVKEYGSFFYASWKEQFERQGIESYKVEAGTISNFSLAKGHFVSRFNFRKIKYGKYVQTYESGGWSPVKKIIGGGSKKKAKKKKHRVEEEEEYLWRWYL